MLILATAHPAVYQEFMEGKFVVQKTDRKFSAMALDQAHEQMNKVIKGDGGAIGLFGNDHALKRWLLSGPEMARVIKEFEEIWDDGEESNMHHDEQSLQRQKSLFDDVKRLEAVMSEYCNPFVKESDDVIINIYDGSIMDGKDVQDALSIEESLFEEIWSRRVVFGKEPITKTLKKNNTRIFKGKPVKEPSRAEQEVKELKSRCQLHSKLYVGCHSAKDDGDLKIFFQHEQVHEPPSLALSEKMRTGSKADLHPCLEGLATDNPQAEEPNGMQRSSMEQQLLIPCDRKPDFEISMTT